MDPELLKLAALAGTAGGMLSVGAFVPQAWRIVRRRSAADVSLVMYLTIVVSSCLWIFYAYAHDSTALLVTNVVIALIAIFIAGLKLRYSEK